MIKGLGEYNGGPLVILGLSKANCERLLGGDPILVRGDEVGVKSLTVLLLGGETEDAIVAELQSMRLIRDDTVVVAPGTVGESTEDTRP